MLKLTEITAYDVLAILCSLNSKTLINVREFLQMEHYSEADLKAFEAYVKEISL